MELSASLNLAQLSCPELRCVPNRDQTSLTDGLNFHGVRLSSNGLSLQGHGSFLRRGRQAGKRIAIAWTFQVCSWLAERSFCWQSPKKKHDGPHLIVIENSSRSGHAGRRNPSLDNPL